jgi:hypothetical protein
VDCVYCYWNQIHGYTPEDVYKDEERVRTLRILADNMAYLIKCKKAAALPLPKEPPPGQPLRYAWYCVQRELCAIDFEFIARLLTIMEEVRYS